MGPRSNLRRGRLTGPVLLAAFGIMFPVGAAARSEVDPTERRAEVLERRTGLSGEIDVLRASNDDLLVALASFDNQLTEQAGRVDEANKTVVTTAAQVAETRAREDVIRADLSRLEQRLRELAVSSYVGPPTDLATVVLLGGPMDELPKRRVLAGVRLEQITDAIDALKAVRTQVEKLRGQLEAAEAGARQAEAEQRARLEELTQAKAQQQAVFDQVAERLDHALAESDELASLDASLTEEIRQHEEESARLADSLRRSAAEEARWAAAALVPAEAAPAAPAAPADETGPPAEEVAAEPEPWSPPPSAAPEAVPAPPEAVPRPAPTRSYQIVPVDTTWVWGIEVASEIAAQLNALLEAAYADGLELTGSGYRNVEDQIEIRRLVCGPTEYDIWDRPSWECAPPVARPGRSMHEKGLAVDFTGPGGDLVRTHDSPTFRWLAANAARFGFYNLPSEPWHWSTTGS